jgi:hypothetical protein
MLFLCDADRAAFEKMSKTDVDKAYGVIGKWWGEQEHKGVITEGAQLQGPDRATTVKARNGKALVTDGPFIEAKESIGGYAIVNVSDLDAAIGLAKEWVQLLPGPWQSSAIVEVRPLLERER